MAWALLPSRLASQIVPSPLLAQYKWLALTVTSKGTAWLGTMTCGLVPSKLASQIAPCLPGGPPVSDQ